MVIIYGINDKEDQAIGENAVHGLISRILRIAWLGPISFEHNIRVSGYHQGFA